MRSGWALALMIVLGRPAGVVGQAASSPDRGTGDRFVMEGVVRDLASGIPLSSVAVSVRTDRDRWERHTDDEGRYRITGPAGGPAWISVSRLGYTDYAVQLRQVRDTMRIDFVLRVAALEIAPLRVDGERESLAMRTLRGVDPVGAHPVGTPAPAPFRLDLAAPFVSVVRVAAVEPGPGRGSTPPPSSSRSHRVRATPTRYSTTLSGGAPTPIPGRSSYLVDPFSGRAPHVTAWDAGAPTHVTGGAEFVYELTDRRASGIGSRALAGLDLIRGAVAADRGGERFAAGAWIESSLPWANDIADSGQRTRALSLGTTVVAESGHLVEVNLSTQSERWSEPGGVGTVADIDQRSGAARWSASALGGVVTARVGASRSRTSLGERSPDEPVPTTPTSVGIIETRSMIAGEFRRDVSESIAVLLGADRLGYDWSAPRPTTASIHGVWAEAAFSSPGSELSVRAGTRIDQAPGHGAPIPAPRIHLTWSGAPDLAVVLGAGIHHQIVPSDRDDALPPSLQRHTTRWMRGGHVRGGVRFGRAPLHVVLEAFGKRIHDRADRDSSTRVVGGHASISGHLGRGTGSLGATVERRTTGAEDRWSGIVSGSLSQHLPGELRLRALASGSFGIGEFRLGLGVDTLGLPGSGDPPTAVPVPSTPSVEADLELDRRFLLPERGVELQPYLQLLNVLGREARPLFTVVGDGAGTDLPRGLVIGMRLVRTRSTPRTAPRPSSGESGSPDLPD